MAEKINANNTRKRSLSVRRRGAKNLAYEDFKQIIGNLQSKIHDYQQFEANAQAVFNEFKQVAERLKSGIYRYDIKSRRFLFFNQYWVRMFGTPSSRASDITSQNILLRLHPDDRERARQAAKITKEPGSSGGELEYRFRKSDGNYRWYYDRWVVLLDACGQPRYLEGIVMDITERKQAVDALKTSQQKLRLLSSYLMEVQEKIWRRIAFELHDELGQSLIVLKLKLKILKESLLSGSDQVEIEYENTAGYVDDIIKNVRRLSQELCPSCLEDLGLDESIALLFEEYAKLTKLQMSVKRDKIDDLFGLKEQTQIYRIFQETLSNIKKHAHAKAVTIEIERTKSLVRIKIFDDGIGFLKEKHAPGNGSKVGLGLTAMEERARMLGGTMQLSSIIGIGTRITLEIPIGDQGEDVDEPIPYRIG